MRGPTALHKRVLSLLSNMLLAAPVAVVAAQEPRDGRELQPQLSMDVRDTSLPSAEDGNFVAVPIPFSNPTLGTGLIGVAAYFYPQSEAQAATQPASVTGLGAMVTNNDGRGLAFAHDAYWDEDRWRFSGSLALADITLPLLSITDEGADILRADWRIQGWSLTSELSRRVGENWYVGVSGGYVDLEQEFSIRILSLEFGVPDELKTVSLGASLKFDTRDMPTNAYRGQYFEAKAASNSIRDSDDSYESYSLAFRSYHALSPSLVLAWELAGCATSGDVPLWDACTIDLRGFATTDFLGSSSVRGQVEARWKFGRRWGLAAFTGAGQISRSFSGERDGKAIPSYGFGLRFMVQPEKRINMRLDFARSTDSDSVHLSVGEAF